MKQLQHYIDYTFKNKALLTRALTHRSAHENHNERLEFLGDSILNLVISDYLFHTFPQKTEGELSRLRASIVRGETLAEIAQSMQLGRYLALGVGELKSGGHRRASILADAFEALIAAIYLDSDFHTCREIILKLCASKLTDNLSDHTVKDPKTRLQEHLQQLKQPLPQYELIKMTGEMHEQYFHVCCQIQNPVRTTTGSGITRRKAEQIAAQAMIEFLKF